MKDIHVKIVFDTSSNFQHLLKKSRRESLVQYIFFWNYKIFKKPLSIHLSNKTEISLKQIKAALIFLWLNFLYVITVLKT